MRKDLRGRQPCPEPLVHVYRQCSGLHRQGNDGQDGGQEGEPASPGHGEAPEGHKRQAEQRQNRREEARPPCSATVPGVPGSVEKHLGERQRRAHKGNWPVAAPEGGQGGQGEEQQRVAPDQATVQPPHLTAKTFPERGNEAGSAFVAVARAQRATEQDGVVERQRCQR